MKTLHIHIGTPKTATTAIQNFCMENEKILEREGYCYPRFPYVYTKVSEGRNGHFLVGPTDGTKWGTTEQERYKEAMGRIRELFLAFDDVILSDEAIWRLMDDSREKLWPSLAKEAKAGGFSLHVIVYLRRQDEYFISTWNHNIKQKVGTYANIPFVGFHENVKKETRLEYYEKLERIAAVVGKEKITVRRFEKKKFAGGSIYADFLSAIGLKMNEAYVISPGIRNIGLYGNTHEMKRVLNGLPEMAEPVSEKFIRDRLIECSEMSGGEYPAEMFSKKETQDFLAHYRTGNQKVAEEYLHEPGGELFDYTVKDAPKWEKENPFVYDDIIRFVGVTAAYLYSDTHEMKRNLGVVPTIKRKKQMSAKEPPEFETLREPDVDLFSKIADGLQKEGKDGTYTADDMVRLAGAASIYLFQENRKLEREMHHLSNSWSDLRHPFRTAVRKIRRIAASGESKHH